MDRDQSVSLLGKIKTMLQLITTINDHCFVPHIITQPTDQTVAIGSDCTFALTAVNVAEYKWQLKGASMGNWISSTATGYNTDTLTLEVASKHYGYQYRCKITGLDGSVIYSDIVHIIEPTE